MNSSQEISSSINTASYFLGPIREGGTGTATDSGVIWDRLLSVHSIVSCNRASNNFNNSRYGSRALGVSARSSGEHVRREIDARSSPISFLKRVAAIQRDSMDTSKVMGGVTFGLPSRVDK